MELKANLYFHIGNPIKRWKIEKVIPVKLILQLVKTLFLIVQVKLIWGESTEPTKVHSVSHLLRGSQGIIDACLRV